jgi:ribosomal protein S18 acetylase RimI-like enzyme
MPARRLKDGLPSDLKSLFLAYPYKQYQARFQGTRREDLAGYHLAQTVREWECDSGQGIWIAVGKGTAKRHRPPTLAFGRVVRSVWHCEVLGREVYRLRPLLCRPANTEALNDLFRAAVRGFRRAGGEFLEVRIDASDFPAEEALIRARFHSLGTSVKLSARSTDLYLTRGKAVAGLKIAPAKESDMRSLGEIVRKAHVTSHFFHEPGFEQRKVRTMFVRWVERCARGIAEEVLVARIEGRAAGFATLLVNRGTADFIGHNIGVIDFVAVHPSAQGQGIGSALLRTGLRRLRCIAPVFEIRTELENFAALRTYTRLGFQLTSADQVWMLSEFPFPAGRGAG